MYILLIIILIIAVFWCTRKTVKEHFLSRPNKCFDCEKQIENSGGDISMAFPGKCFDCEKQSKFPYLAGATKCFDCKDTLEEGSNIVKKDTYHFSTFGRNSYMMSR